MGAPASAYAALGLEPGADRRAIEEAYRRLIKVHHPDRSGGNAERAAELNRAYFELRKEQEPTAPTSEVPAPSRRVRPRRKKRSRSARGRRSSGLAPVLVIVLGALLLVERESVVEFGTRWLNRFGDLGAPGPGRAGTVEMDSTAIDGPLDEPVIATSIEQAEKLVRRGEEDTVQHSRACHRRMRAEPGLEQLDRCAAFDNAVVALADQSPIDLGGAFDASAVTARHMTAARLLSSDYLALERRLDRIRALVDRTLTPPTPVPPPPSENFDAPPDLDANGF